MSSPSKRVNNNNNTFDTDPLGVIPTQRLLKDLENISQAKHFLEEYHSLLEDDCNEYERQLTLHAAATSTSKKSHHSSSSVPVIPLAQYMIVPLSLVRLVGGVNDTSNDDWLMKYLSCANTVCEHKIEEKFAKMFSSTGKNCLYKPLQIVFRSPLPTTTFEQRRLQREKFRVARAHQEREAYNRMLRGNYEGSTQNSNSSNNTSNNNNKTEDATSLQTMTERLFENVLFKQQVDPKKNPATAASAMRLKATSGGAGFLAKDAFSSSSRQEMESIAGMSAKCSDAEVAAAAANGGDSMIKKISRDIGLGLDVPLMALAGAVVGWYACSLRGFSSNESAIGAAVCATIMLIVDGGLVMMKLAREDLKSTKEKKRREEELKKAVKTSMATTMGTAAERSKMVAAEHERKKQNYRVISREVVSETAIDQEKEEEKEKKKEAKKTK